MSSRQPDHRNPRTCRWGIWEMLSSCLSLDGIDEGRDNCDVPSDDKFRSWARREHVGYHERPVEGFFPPRIRKLTLDKPALDSSSQGSNSMPVPVVSEQEKQEASENPIGLALGLEATSACPKCGYGPLRLALASVSSLDLSTCEVGVREELEQGPDYPDNFQYDDSRSGPAPGVLSSAYPSDPGNDSEEDYDDDGNEGDGGSEPESSSGQTDYSSEAESTDYDGDNDSDDGSHDGSDLGPPTPPFTFAIPLEQPQLDGNQEAGSQVDTGLDMEHPLQLPPYWATRSAYQDPHLGDISHNNAYPAYSTARSGATELTPPYPEYDEYDASGEDNDEDGDGNIDNTNRGLAISGQESQTNYITCRPRQRRAIKALPLMSPPAHESCRGGFHGASPPSEVDSLAVVAGRDPPKVAASAAGAEASGATAASNKPSRGIKRIPGAVESVRGLSVLSNFNTTHQLQQCNCIQDTANVGEKRIASQLEPLASNLPAGVVRAVLHVHRAGESTRDHSSSDLLDETVGEDGNEGHDENCDEDSDESGDGD
ncbi:hypothetical protein HOY80DRAFT_366731 [Tuber brumale]|nr:hypothetical protein HOY80DRAFT_366731 [Tuber brumale]